GQGPEKWRPPKEPPSSSCRAIAALSGDEAAQHVVQDAAILVVVELVGRIDAAERFDSDHFAIGAGDAHIDLGARLKAGDIENVYLLAAIEAQGLPAFAVLELQRDDAHADQVR